MKHLKRFIIVTLCLAVVLSLLPGVAVATNDNGAVTSIVDSYVPGTGTFTLSDSARFYIVSDTEPTERLAETVQLASSAFAAKGKPSASTLPIVWGKEGLAENGDILLCQTTGLGEEGYKVEVTSTNMKVYYSVGTASAYDGDYSYNGLLYGLNTVLKCFLVNGTNVIACCTMTDAPDTKERTLMLDVARKYWSVEWIKNLIAEMSWMGYNTLELHLTEDQGIRANIWQDANGNTVLDCNGNDFSWLPGYKAATWASNSGNGQGLTSGVEDPNGDCTYSREDLIEICTWAKEHHIGIIPAVDVPGHCDYFIYQWGAAGKNNGFTFNYQNVAYSNPPSVIYDTGSSIYGSASAYPMYGTLDVGNSYVNNLSLAFIEAYADFFRTYAGSTKFNIGCDEIRGNLSYDTFVSYVNGTCAMLKGRGYTVRAFGDYLNGTSSVPLDSELEICYWGGENDAPLSAFTDQNRKVYNCVNNFTYYVLRYNKDYGDARSATCLQWGFHHANEAWIYAGCGDNCTPICYYNDSGSQGGGWNPGKLYFVDTAISEQNANTLSQDDARMGGGYFLIWGDWAGWCSEDKVWNGIDSNRLYNLIDRMWSNSAKMWNWDQDAALSYTNFSSYVATVRDYPGYQGCTTAASLPAAKPVQRACLADHTVLESYLDNVLSGSPYTTETYDVYLAAIQAGRTVAANAASTQTEVDSAVAAIENAINGLVRKAVVVKIEYKTYVGDQELLLKPTEELTLTHGETYSFTVHLRKGYVLKAVEGGVLEGNVARVVAGDDVTVSVIYTNAPYLADLQELLANQVSSEGYTQESYAVYDAAVKAAEEFLAKVADSPETTTYQEEVDSYAAALAQGYNSLVAAGAEGALEITGCTLTTDYVAASMQAAVLVDTTGNVSEITVKLGDAPVEPTVIGSRINHDGSKTWLVCFRVSSVPNPEEGYTYTICAGEASKELKVPVK